MTTKSERVALIKLLIADGKLHIMPCDDRSEPKPMSHREDAERFAMWQMLRKRAYLEP